MNTPVSFELSRLLKDRGFEQNTECAYRTDGTKITFKGQGGINANLNYNHFRQNHRNPLTSAPTTIEVVMWLYEKHGIWITSEPFIESKNNSLVFIYKIFKNNYIDTISRGSKGFSSLLESYEEGIKYTLNNIK